MGDKLPAQRGRKSGIAKNSILNQLRRKYGKGFHPIMRQAELAIKMQDLAEATEANSDKSTRDKLLAYKAAADTWDKISPYIVPKKKSVEVTSTVAVVSIKAALDSALDNANRVIDGELEDDEDSRVDMVEQIANDMHAIEHDVTDSALIVDPGAVEPGAVKRRSLPMFGPMVDN